jgi:hypothetical protein
MSAQNKAAGQNDTAAKTAHPDDTQKTRVAMLCHCGGEVTHRRYWFDAIAMTPHLVWSRFYVCDLCEAALTGDDAAARHAAEQAFAAYLEASDHAPST